MGFDGERQVRACSNCGELAWDTTTRFCAKCGKSISEEMENTILAKRCPKCHTLSTLNACAICGEDLKSVPSEKVSRTDPGWC